MSDSVEVGVTHQIKIDREDAWIKVSVNREVRPTETYADAIESANKVVQQKVMDVILSTVKTVNEFTKEN